MQESGIGEQGPGDQGTRDQEAREQKALTIQEVPQLQRAHRRAFDMSLATKLAEPKPEPMRRAAEGFMCLAGQVLTRLCTNEEMTDSGKLYIPETAQEKPVEGIVLGTSRGKWDRSGMWVPTEVAEGDRVLFGKYSGTKLVLRGEEVRLMREEELLLVIK